MVCYMILALLCRRKKEMAVGESVNPLDIVQPNGGAFAAYVCSAVAAIKLNYGMGGSF